MLTLIIPDNPAWSINATKVAECATCINNQFYIVFFHQLDDIIKFVEIIYTFLTLNPIPSGKGTDRIESQFLHSLDIIFPFTHWHIF